MRGRGEEGRDEKRRWEMEMKKRRDNKEGDEKGREGDWGDIEGGRRKGRRKKEELAG
jgi:hypothetical protein